MQSGRGGKFDFDHHFNFFNHLTEEIEFIRDRFFLARLFQQDLLNSKSPPSPSVFESCCVFVSPEIGGIGRDDWTFLIEALIGQELLGHITIYINKNMRQFGVAHEI